MTSIANIGQRGQVTLPKAIRQALNLKRGDKIAFIRRGDEIILQPFTQTLLDLRGSVPVEGEQDFNAIRQQVQQDIANKTGKSDE